MAFNKKYDIIIAGAGHAGCEAALAAVRCGFTALLLTMNTDTAAKMSCNPAIGGLAKGHLVREIDALGGEMAVNTDMTGIQFRMLNRSKGPAVWSPRAQSDKALYSARMKDVLNNTENLTYAAGEAVDVIVNNGRTEGIVLKSGEEIRSNAVIITAGTFLGGIIFRGREAIPAGRIDEPSAVGLTAALEKHGIESARFKTGTPPRIDSRQIDFTKFDRQDGDAEPKKFSFRGIKPPLRQVPCYLGYSSEKTHDILRTGFGDSPLFSGKISGTGPRYCPSIEDKIRRFPDKNRHQIFLEPEGLDTNLYYVNGFSTSLDPEIQKKGLQSIPGLEKVSPVIYGYAIEYDYFLPGRLKPTLESWVLSGLFLAGQVNGTSGYEEAAAQGIMAGLNAVRYIRNEEPVILSRDEAYIGVLIDDIITKPIDEPYRLFTSRAESRLLLRQDNADERLMKYGLEFGLIDQKMYDRMAAKRETRDNIISGLKSNRVKPEEANPVLKSAASSTIKTAETLHKILKRPEIKIAQILEMDSEIGIDNEFDLLGDFGAQVEMEVKYEGYIDRIKKQFERVRKMENMVLPDGLSYAEMSFLSMEAREKFNAIRPRTLGMASRIAGISPSDITNLSVFLRKN